MKVNIRTLRLRMGWSQSELARRLNCQLTDIEIFENGKEEPDTQIQNELEFLEKQAQVCSEEIQSFVKIEKILEEKPLDQIPHDYIYSEKKELNPK